MAQLEVIYLEPVASGLLKDRGRLVRRLTVRPSLGRDHLRLEAVRVPDRQWLESWESTMPPGVAEVPPSFNRFRRISDWQCVRGTALPMVIEVDDLPVGLVSVANVQRGALYAGTLGYWVHSGWAGCGIGSLAVASVIDLLLGELGLHRVEINIRPENRPSLALVAKLGLTCEGRRPRYMNIAGQWCDHLAFAVDTESLPEGGLVAAHWPVAR